MRYSIKTLFEYYDNTTLSEKQQRFQHYHQVKLINRNILQVKKYYLWIKCRIIEQDKFLYSSLEKAFKKQMKTIEYQGKKQVESFKSIRRSRKTKINRRNFS